MRLWFRQAPAQDRIIVTDTDGSERPANASGYEHGRTLELTEPRKSDFAQWKALREESRDFLEPWEPRWPVRDLTPSGFRRRMISYETQRMQKTGYIWFIRDLVTQEILGGISITGIRMGAARSGHIGYWLGRRHTGKGIMRRVLPAICHHGFSEIGLCRLEAASLPHNCRSLRVLEACGFSREGMARDYLEINGERRDHLVFSLLPTDLPSKT